MPYALPEIAVLGGAAYEAEHHGLLDTRSAAGWSTIIALAAFAFLTFTLSRGRGLLAGALQASGFVVLVWAAKVPANYLIRAHAAHPDKSDRAFWGGLDIVS